MSRGLICVFLFSALFAVALGDYRLIKGPANFKSESTCVAQNGVKYYLGTLKESEDQYGESALFSVNFETGKTERIFSDYLQRARSVMSQNDKSLTGLTTEHMGSPTLVCAGNKLYLELTLEKMGQGVAFTREHRTHMIFDIDLDISPAQKSFLSQ